MKGEKNRMCSGNNSLPIGEKYMLTINEASAYFGIGIKTIRRIAETNKGNFTLHMGNRYLIVRHKFEAYIDEVIENGIGAIEDE